MKSETKQIIDWLNKENIFHPYKITKIQEFGKWYIKNFGRLPDVDLIDDLRSVVYKEENNLRVKQGALKHEKHIVNTFEHAVKAWISLKEKKSE